MCVCVCVCVCECECVWCTAYTIIILYKYIVRACTMRRCVHLCVYVLLRVCVCVCVCNYNCTNIYVPNKSTPAKLNSIHYHC